MPEVKRNRGRPRKIKDPAAVADEAKVFRVKRGRGRPRKNSLNSNQSNTQNSYLEEGKRTMDAYFSATLVTHKFISKPQSLGLSL